MSRGVFSSVWKCFWVCAVGASREQPAVAVLWAVRTAVSADDNDPTWSQSLNCTVSAEEVCHVSAHRTVRVSCDIPDQHHLVRCRHEHKLEAWRARIPPSPLCRVLILVSFIMAVIFLNSFDAGKKLGICWVRSVNSHSSASRVHFNDGLRISSSGREASHCVTVGSCRGTLCGHVVFLIEKYPHTKFLCDFHVKTQKGFPFF